MDKIGKTLFLLELAILTGKKAFKIKQLYDNNFAEFYYKLLIALTFKQPGVNGMRMFVYFVIPVSQSKTLNISYVRMKLFKM